MMSDKVQVSIAEALEQLQQERARIEGAICKLEGCLQHLVSSATTTVRGRQEHLKAMMQKPRIRAQARARSRAGWTDAARLAAAQRMRGYWESRRVAQASGDVPTRRTRVAKRPQAQTPTARTRSVNGWTAEKREAARARMRQYWLRRKDAVQA